MKNLITAFIYSSILVNVILTVPVFGKTVEYEINIEYQTVNYTGGNVQAMTIGGTIPGKTIEASEGDTLRVTFHNKMDVETSIHWHGIILPNDQDGVPYLTTLPIRAGESFTYEYPVVQSGTYWYHSHTGLQEQRGVYGALIFYPKQRVQYDKEYIVSLSDWTDENPNSVLRHLKMDADYYALKKGTVQSWKKVLQYGWKAVWIRLKSGWIRMGPMDITDVGYDMFLLNGKASNEIGDAKPGEKILLRVINMSASTHFDVEFAGGKMQVIAADGVDVVPHEVNRFRIAIAETYDVLVSIPEDKAYELRATSMDGSGYASGFVGRGEKVSAPDMPRPNLFLMDHAQHGADHSSHTSHAQKTEANAPMGDEGHDHAKMLAAQNSFRILTYEDLKATKVTTLPHDAPVREITLRLTGSMERYVWSFNDKTLEESDSILIRKGENVRIKLINETMMDHPIHLHGHFFRVLNQHGPYSPLKHTVDVKAFETKTIEFFADQEKDWLFHCHILYHMMTGMSRVFSYEGSVYPPELEHMRKHHRVHSDHAHSYAWGNVSAQSNMVEGFLKWTDDKNQLEAEWDNNYTGEYDVEPKYLRNVSRFLDLYVGGEFKKEEDEIENHATWGFRYVLPMLIEMEYKMDYRGGQEIRFHSSIQLTDRLEARAFYELGFGFEHPWRYSEYEIEHDYRTELEYRVTKNFSLVGNYDSDHRGGGGVRLRF